MSRVLAFETSSRVLSVAVKNERGACVQAKIKGFLKHAENLLPGTDRLLEKIKLSIRDIDSFLIGRGPGSFTGLRIGYATLKAFLALHPRPCYGALSLDLIAENANPLEEGSHLGVLLDAHRERIYARLYQRKKKTWTAAAKAATISVGELCAAFPPEIYLAGDALVRYREILEEKSGGKKLCFLPEKFWHPEAQTLIRWFETGDKRLRRLVRPVDFQPLYFRLSEAEEKRKIHAYAC